MIYQKWNASLGVKNRDTHTHKQSCLHRQLWNDDFKIYSISLCLSWTACMQAVNIIIIPCWHLCVNRWICDSVCMSFVLNIIYYCYYIGFGEEMRKKQQQQKNSTNIWRNLIGCRAQITVSKRLIRWAKKRHSRNTFLTTTTMMMSDADGMLLLFYIFLMLWHTHTCRLFTLLVSSPQAILASYNNS